MKRLKAGVIGLGVGEAHLKAYNAHPKCEVMAACDLSRDKLAAAKKKYPHIKLYADASELIDDPDVDVVSIASYDNYHYQQIVKAIRKGKHIFVEKPLCLYRRECVHIKKLLEKKPHLKISSNLILRKSPRFRSLKKLIADGEMGKIFYIEGDYNYGRLNKITEGWRGRIDFYSVVYGGGVHIIDLFLWLTGERVLEVAAYGNNISSRNTQFRYNDTVAAILKFENGIVGKITSNYACVFPHFHALSAYGTEATFINTTGEALLYESRDPAKKPRKIKSAYPGVDKGDLAYGFIDSIINNNDPEVTKEDVFKVMSVCFAIEKAVEKGKPVKVSYI